MATLTDNTFAAACYDQNTVDELRAALAGDPDTIDMATWGLSADEWREEIRKALTAKLADE
mgnify:CR=1 FL=1